MQVVPLILLFLVVVHSQTVRVLFNYPNNVGNLNIVDYNVATTKITRSATLVLGVGIAGTGAQNLLTLSGYVTADESNLYSLQTYTNPPMLQQQVSLFSHATCLGNYLGLASGNPPLGAVGVDPLNQFVYVTWTTQAGILRAMYDGEGDVHDPYSYSGTAQIVVDYSRQILYLLPAVSSLSFNVFTISTNGTAVVNVDSPLVGGLSLDNTSGIVYLATQAGIMNYNPTTGIFSSVYVNADLTFHGIVIDSVNGLLFFSAVSTSKATSSLYVVAITLPAGTVTQTPIALQTTVTNQFVSMAIAHCAPGACGNCGTVPLTGVSSTMIPLSIIVTLLVVALVN